MYVGQRPCCGIPCALSEGTYPSASAQERAAGDQRLTRYRPKQCGRRRSSSGGVLVATVGPGTTLLIDGLNLGSFAVLVLLLRPLTQQRPVPKSVLQDLRVSWQEFTSNTWLWVIVLQFSLFVATGKTVFGLLGPAVTRDLMNGPTDRGFFASAHGAGTLLSGLLGIQLRPRHPMYMASCCVLFLP